MTRKTGKGKKKSRGKRTGKDCNVQETIDPVRKSNFVAPEVHVGQKVYVTLDTAYKCRYGRIAAAFLGYNKNWKKNFKIPGYVVQITLNNLN